MKGQIKGRRTARQKNESVFALKGTKAKALITVCSSFEINKSFGEAVGRCISLYMLDRYATFVYLKLFKGVAITFPFSSRITAQLFEAVELAEEFFSPPPPWPLSFSQSPSPPISPLPTPALSPLPLNLPPTTDPVNPKESEISINNVKITQTENKMKEKITVNVMYKNGKQASALVDAKAVVAICPSFEISTDPLKLTPEKSLCPSVAQLIACSKQIHAAQGIYFLIGYGLLLWDYLFLDSLCTPDSLKLPEKKEEKEFLGSKENPKIKDYKVQVKEEERQLITEALKKEPSSQELKFIYSGDLLDDPACNQLYERLNYFIELKTEQQPKSQKQKDPKHKWHEIKWRLDGLSDNFIENRFSEVLKGNWVYKYNSDIPIKTVLKAYMREYIRYEFAIFSHLAFTQGFTFLFSDSATESHIKAFRLLMECLSTPIRNIQPSLPLLSQEKKMQLVQIGFKSEPLSPLPSPHQSHRRPSPPPLLPEAKFNLSGSEKEQICDQVCNVIKSILNTDGASSLIKFLSVQAVVGQIKSMSPPEAKKTEDLPNSQILNGMTFAFVSQEKRDVSEVSGLAPQASS